MILQTKVVVFPVLVDAGVVVHDVMEPGVGSVHVGPITVQETVPVGAIPPRPVTAAEKTRFDPRPPEPPDPVRTILPVGELLPTVTDAMLLGPTGA